MIKDPESFYECKRSTTWLKLKPVIEISLKVTLTKKVQKKRETRSTYCRRRG